MGALHGRICYAFEKAVRSAIGLDDSSVKNTFVSADRVEMGTMVEAMLYLLRQKLGYEYDLSCFIEETKLYLGMPVDEMPEGIPRQLLDSFFKLWDNTIHS